MKKQKVQPKEKISKPSHQLAFVGIFLLAGLIIGLIAGYFLFHSRHKSDLRADKPVSEKTLVNVDEIRLGGAYELTNPLLDCDNFEPSILPNHVKLKKALATYVDTNVKNGNAKSISVYFRSMDNGPWIGIGENTMYPPASLLKVPLMIAILKKAEKDPEILKSKVYYNQIMDASHSPNIHSAKKLEIGNTYTVDQLLEYMISYSDNNAKEILLKFVDDDFLFKVFIDLGVDMQHRDLQQDFITCREYSSFFRILYNASYLSRDMSEKALKLLTKTSFHQGIPNPLPDNIIVAHKFGERAYPDSNIKQLHDCGIVYFEGRPYLLCVMTLGTDFDKLVKIISDISALTYNEISKSSD
ncbi:MAG TPA: class A beta-lactamase-related serine hydrolase [Bacteroidales bacterium]|nr:class A beta-lactamase-related serine hydrolase [Bacteroidales bacterium]